MLRVSTVAELVTVATNRWNDWTTEHSFKRKNTRFELLLLGRFDHLTGRWQALWRPWPNRSPRPRLLMDDGMPNLHIFHAILFSLVEMKIAWSQSRASFAGDQCPGRVAEKVTPLDIEQCFEARGVFRCLEQMKCHVWNVWHFTSTMVIVDMTLSILHCFVRFSHTPLFISLSSFLNRMLALIVHIPTNIEMLVLNIMVSDDLGMGGCEANVPDTAGPSQVKAFFAL